VIDYELRFRTPEHEDRVKATPAALLFGRSAVAGSNRRRCHPTLSRTESRRAVHLRPRGKHRRPHVGRDGTRASHSPNDGARPPSLSLSGDNEVFYTVTKDNIHLVSGNVRVVSSRRTRKFSPEE